MAAKERTDLLQGTLDMLILEALSLARCRAMASAGVSCNWLKICSELKKAHSIRRSTGWKSAG
jgi:hypothetical protein